MFFDLSYLFIFHYYNGWCTSLNHMNIYMLSYLCMPFTSFGWIIKWRPKITLFHLSCTGKKNKRLHGLALALCPYIQGHTLFTVLSQIAGSKEGWIYVDKHQYVCVIVCVYIDRDQDINRPTHIQRVEAEREIEREREKRRPIEEQVDFRFEQYLFLLFFFLSSTYKSCLRRSFSKKSFTWLIWGILKLVLINTS